MALLTREHKTKINNIFKGLEELLSMGFLSEGAMMRPFQEPSSSSYSV